MEAFLLSIIAALIIEYLIYKVYAGGWQEAFTPPTSGLFIPLVAIAYLVYTRLRVFAENARWPVERLLPPGIAGAALAFILTLSPATRLASAVLVSLVYYVELAVGVKLYKDLKSLSWVGALLFVAGMAAFILTLPLSILDSRLALVPLAANATKTLGLAVLLVSSYRNPSWTAVGGREGSNGGAG